MAFTQNFNSNTFGPVQWKLMGPIADRPATADLHTTYLSTDEGDGVLKAYLYTESGWMQMQGIEGFTSGSGGGSGGDSDMFIVTLTCTHDESTDTTTYSADKTFAEIDTAYRARKAVYLREVDPEDETNVRWFPPATAIGTGDGVSVSSYWWGCVSFSIPNYASQNGSLYFDEYALSSQGEWEYKFGEYTVSPKS